MSHAPKTCPHCGRSFTGGGVRGFCPSCLGALGFAVDDDLTRPDTPDRGSEGWPAASPAEDQPTSSAPTVRLRQYGDYELIEEIARGGMGVVFKARQRKLDRVVALKLLLSGQFASREAIDRFRAEALTAAKLRHPNIVPVYDVGEANGQPFITMELVAGGNLADLVREQPLPARQAAQYVRAIAEAVQHAHDEGILHRDLKPSNVLLDESGQPRVTDFGLAKRLSPNSEFGNPKSESELTLTGQILGSPSFIAPEQAAGKRGDLGPAVDVYSLGALLYHLLTARAPFQAASITETLREVMEREPVSPRLLISSVPRDLETICLKCLEKEPRKRYGSARDLAGELGRFLDDTPILARPAGPVEKLWRWCRRKPLVAALVVAVHLALALGLSGILWQWRRAERQANVAKENAARETTQRLRAEEAVTMLELQRAEDLLEKDETVRGVAHLARIVRQQPDNHVAATRLISALTQRDFVLPVGPPLQHERRVAYTEFSPDGRRIVTTSIDRTARLWDAHTGQPIGEPMRHSNAVLYARFSPDGQRVLTVSDSPEALLWDIATGRVIGQPMRHEKRVRDAQFSPDGQQIATASDDKTARLWDARTGEALFPPLPHLDSVSFIRFSPNSRWLVTICGGTAFLWDAKSGRALGRPLSQGTNPNIDGLRLNCAQFSPDSRWIVTASDAAYARVWDIATGKPIARPLTHKERVLWAEFSPDGLRVVTASETGESQVWDASTGAALTGNPSPSGLMRTVQWSTDGQRLLEVFADNTVRLRDPFTCRHPAVPFQLESIINNASFSPDGQFVVIASSAHAQLWDLRPGRALDVVLTPAAPVHSVHFSPDGKWLATSLRDGTARVWDSRTGVLCLPPLHHPGGTYPAAFSPDGKRLLTASWNGTARLWDALTGQPLCEPLQNDSKVWHAEFSPDGKWVLTLSQHKAVRLWDAHTGQLHSELVRAKDISFVARFSPDSQTVAFDRDDDSSVHIVEINTKRLRTVLRGHREFVSNLQFSSDGRRIITGSQDNTARIWDTATGEQLTAPLVHKSFVECAQFSPDGLSVITASGDGTAIVWEAASGRPRSEPMRHRGNVWEASFSPDGQQVVTASFDCTARLWDSRTGLPLTDALRHDDVVYRTAFSPDGQRLATASRDGTARISELPPAIPRRRRPEPTRADFETPPSPLMLATNQTEPTPATTLTDLAEAVVGQRMNDNGTLEPVSSERLVELRQWVSALKSPLPATGSIQSKNAIATQTNVSEAPALRTASTNSFTRWFAWFLDDRSTRTISPNSSITIPEYVSRLIEQRTLSAAREAVLLSPTNAVALAHLADMLLTSPGSNTPVTISEAEFLRRRAEAMARLGR